MEPIEQTIVQTHTLVKGLVYLCCGRRRILRRTTIGSGLLGPSSRQLRVEISHEQPRWNLKILVDAKRELLRGFATCAQSKTDDDNSNQNSNELTGTRRYQFEHVNTHTLTSTCIYILTPPIPVKMYCAYTESQDALSLIKLHRPCVHLPNVFIVFFQKKLSCTLVEEISLSSCSTT